MSDEATEKRRDRVPDVDVITRALKKGVRDALRRHKLLGQSVVVMKDGKIVWLRPEEIPDDVLEVDED